MLDDEIEKLRQRLELNEEDIWARVRLATPYVRAKTEAEGKSSIAVIGDRGWRNRILIVGLLLSQPVWTLGSLAVITNFSAIARLIQATRKGEP